MNNRHKTWRPRLERLEDRLVLSGSLDLTGVEWRAIDGTGNNLAAPDQGAAETRQIRFGYGAQFPDGFGDAIITAPQRANPRTISNTIHAQTASVVNDRYLTDWAFQWGQWITHDMDLTRNGPQWDELFGGGVGDFRIPIEDPNDPLGPNPISFHRSEFDPLTGTPDPVPAPIPHLNRREVINSVTSYIDASMVYGSDPVRAAALRTFQGGELKTSADGKLLPLNTDGLENADPFRLGDQLFLAGDVRANEQTGLTAVHTLFVREHNRLAKRIAHLYPGLGDEEIYQIARRLVGAEMQIITYEEYLPAVLGSDYAPNPADAVYDPAVNATITNSFAHGAFRFGHSQINERLLLVNNGGHTVSSLSIRDAFFNPAILQNDPAAVSRVLKGLASQLSQEIDLLLVDGVRNNLFGPPGAGGLDLAALDIQRGRDHGLPDYNNLRARYGLAAVTSFAEISSDPLTQERLQQLFGNVNNIDLFVGALAEDHLPGSSVGPLLHAIVANQFERLRDGDRFFYTQDAFLWSDVIERIIDLDEVTLANVIRWNTSINHIQDNVFFGTAVAIGLRAGGDVAQLDRRPLSEGDSAMLLRTVLDLVKPDARSTQTARPLTQRPQLELLEDRSVPAVWIADPVGDFLPTYTGPQDPGLDVTAHRVMVTPERVIFGGKMAGPIAPTQELGGLYIFGVDRGQGTPRFQTGTPPIGPNVTWDLVVRINPNGTGLVNNLVGGGVTQIDPADIHIDGNEFTASVPLSVLLPAATRPPAEWTYNLWPRNSAVIGNTAAVSDLAPDDGNSPVRVVPPTTAHTATSPLVQVLENESNPTTLDAFLLAAFTGLDNAVTQFYRTDPLIPPNPVRFAPVFALNYETESESLPALYGLGIASGSVSDYATDNSPLFYGLSNDDGGDDGGDNPGGGHGSGGGGRNGDAGAD